MTAPTISIVIAAYNRAELLRETLDSIRAQTRDDWECIVVDDHSTDSTADTIRQYEAMDSRFQFRTRPLDHPRGASSGRNEGYRASRGRFLYFFDSDDLLDPEFLETFVPYLERDDELDVLNFRQHRFSGRPDHIIRTTKPKPADLSLGEAILAQRVGQGTENFLWRRTLLERQAYLWDESLQFGEDRELAFRLVCDAKKSLSIDEPVLVRYRRSTDGICRRWRFDRLKLLSTFKLCESYARTCHTKGVSPEAEKFLSRFLVKNMKMALEFGDAEYLHKFDALRQTLQADERDARRGNRYRTASLWRRLGLRVSFYAGKTLQRLIDAASALCWGRAR